ncbi:MAG: beta-ketoacyl synthase N-terminal-like domain-containing protein [Kibdelosporangium sp.]
MTENSVAVIGMACRYPQAGDVGQFWANLRAGAEGITHFERDDLVARGVELARRPDFVPAKGVMAGSGNFDWAFFNYSRAEATGIDPQQRVFLECASAAIDDAGIDPARFPGWIGVYAGADVVGVSTDGSQSELAQVIGREKDFLATRVAYKLGFRGPAVTVQTACSTSLTATHLAVKSLLGHECDAALAGGVTVTAKGEWGYLYEQGGILSPDGHCRPFDENAGGTVPSEGVGVVVLKRLEDALRDGDQIAAVIMGSAINNDGADKMGYTAPSITGQSEVIDYALRTAGIDPADIDYVEAHGTATRMGDPVEVQALTDVFRTSTDATGWCLLGAVKSNIGHTGAAAGVAGLIKTVLMVRRGEVVPTLHFENPNPLLDIESTPFKVCASAGPWPDRGIPLAAVSSFGVGGTNAHLVLRAAPGRDRPARPGRRILPLSAASADALNTTRQDLAERLSTPGYALSEVSRTLAGRRSYRHRQAIVADDTAQAARLLSDPAQTVASSLHNAVFLFPGQGTLKNAAGAAPYRLLNGFHKSFDEISDHIRAAHDLDLSPVIEAGDPEWFASTVHQQMGLFALGYALGRQLTDWGIRPKAMFGNSIGEYTAAALAGVWDLDVAAGLVYERATAMWLTEPGVMVAVDADVAEVVRRIGPDSEISVAVAGPGRTVVSGDVASVDKLLANDDLRGLEVRTLATRRAFHSPAMRPAAEILRAAVAGAPSRRPGVRLISNETGDWADPDAMLGPDYWSGQLLRCVNLTGGAAALLAAGHDTVIELGPGTSMIGTLRRHPGWAATNSAIPLLRGSEDSERDLMNALGALWERGADQVLADISPDAESLRCSLPPHPFTAMSPDVEPIAATTRLVVRERSTDQSVRTVLKQLWCTSLGVSTVADSDDFHALGGESLMIVNLLRQVQDRTGRAVPVIEFAERPTFGALVRLVGPDWPAGVLTLHEQELERPFFLAADAMGTALGYRALATRLDRPVYGLEPVRQAARGIDHVAAEHIERMLAIQPAGPYTVGGWSFGAVVAHEIARQLTRRGEQVDLLVCLDGYIPRIRWPIGSDTDYLLASVRSQADALLGTGPIGRRMRRAPEVRRQFVANIGALLRYRPQPVDCPAVVFKASTSHEGAARLQARLARTYAGGVVVHPVGGDHWSMLADPHVHDLATRLREVLPGRTPEPATVQTGERYVR